MWTPGCAQSSGARSAARTWGACRMGSPSDETSWFASSRSRVSESESVPVLKRDGEPPLPAEARPAPSQPVNPARARCISEFDWDRIGFLALFRLQGIPGAWPRCTCEVSLLGFCWSGARRGVAGGGWALGGLRGVKSGAAEVADGEAQVTSNSSRRTQLFDSHAPVARSAASPPTSACAGVQVLEA